MRDLPAPDALALDLLHWYDRHARDMPWRVPPAARKAGVCPDPYQVWLSEIMLQQTTVKHAAPYWEKFLELYPTVKALADAPREEVLSHWAGLGYYSRARNLLSTARLIVDHHGGNFPDQYKELIKLKGIGDYTASAIASQPPHAWWLDKSAQRPQATAASIPCHLGKRFGRRFAIRNQGR